MSVDLLRFVAGPEPYSAWWWWFALALIAVVITWYTAVFTWTMPSWRLRRIPAVRLAHARLIRRKFDRAIRDIDDKRRAGDLSDAQAFAAMNRTLRSFLHQKTGVRAQYQHIEDVTDSEIAAAAPLLETLNDARFNTRSDVDAQRVGSDVRELIRTWN